jgi:hypothetical protein
MCQNHINGNELIKNISEYEKIIVIGIHGYRNGRWCQRPESWL